MSSTARTTKRRIETTHWRATGRLSAIGGKPAMVAPATVSSSIAPRVSRMDSPRSLTNLRVSVSS
jgi:hypothetical protein